MESTRDPRAICRDAFSKWNSSAATWSQNDSRAMDRDAASTPYCADCRNVSLTEGYESKFPLFHKLFLSGVENRDTPPSDGKYQSANVFETTSLHKKSRPSGRLYGIQKGRRWSKSYPAAATSSSVF